MTISEIVALGASIFNAISGISAAIACFLTYRTTRPQLKLTPSSRQEHRCYVNWKNKSFALLCFELANSSTITGTLDDLWIVYNGKEYHAENVYTNFDPSPLKIKSFFDDKIEQDSNPLHLKIPLKVDGFSIVSGFVFFPTFPVVQTNNIVVNIYYRFTNKKFKRKIRKVNFSLVTPI